MTSGWNLLSMVERFFCVFFFFLNLAYLSIDPLLTGLNILSNDQGCNNTQNFNTIHCRYSKNNHGLNFHPEAFGMVLK